MRATHSGKDLAREIALLKEQLEELSSTMNGTGHSMVERGEAAIEDTLRSARSLIGRYGDTAKSIAEDTVKLKDKATDTLIEHTEARPLTTLAAIVGIGFLAGWLCRRS
ncbi:hypothetical protein [Reyranella sp.]|uniref:hypothetical protein n=1 Tax=Reyranella sp. TaxID=1929291 RepID=UPI003BA87C11